MYTYTYEGREQWNTHPYVLVDDLIRWSFNDIGQATLGAMLKIDTDHTIPDWLNFHRDLCPDWVRAHQQPIEGPGHVVQIDESVITRPKRPKRARGQRVRPFPLRCPN